jgi:hypothetical protein
MSVVPITAGDTGEDERAVITLAALMVYGIRPM